MENPIDRIRRLLLEDVKTGSLSWFYISVADTEFRGGYVIQARGPTEAWTLFHRLDWGYKGANTITCPIPEEQMVNIPASMRWRKLTKDEANKLGEPREQQEETSSQVPGDGRSHS
jgi:hypothetical protein